MIDDVARKAVDAALAELPTAMDSPEARVLLFAIGLQESRLAHRVQISPGAPGGRGPARGLWQFERMGGCAGTLRHKASRYWMVTACEKRGVEPKPAQLWTALEFDDVLAAVTARLYLFTDPYRLPALGEAQKAWDTYLRVWRPGKPHPRTWAKNYAEAFEEVMGADHG